VQKRNAANLLLENISVFLPNKVCTLTKNGLTLNPKFYQHPPFLAGDTSRSAALCKGAP